MEVFVEYPDGKKVMRELTCNIPASYGDKNTWGEDRATEIIIWALETNEYKLSHGIFSMSINTYWKAKRYLDAYSNIDWLMWEAINIGGIDINTAFEIKEEEENRIARDRELTADDLELIFTSLMQEFREILE